MSESKLSKFHAAVIDGDIELIEHFIRYEKIDLNLKLDLGRTVLHWCLGEDRKTNREILLRSGADPSIQDDFGLSGINRLGLDVVIPPMNAGLDDEMFGKISNKIITDLLIMDWKVIKYIKKPSKHFFAFARISAYKSCSLGLFDTWHKEFEKEVILNED